MLSILAFTLVVGAAAAPAHAPVASGELGAADYDVSTIREQVTLPLRQGRRLPSDRLKLSDAALDKIMAGLAEHASGRNYEDDFRWHWWLQTAHPENILDVARIWLRILETGKDPLRLDARDFAQLDSVAWPRTEEAQELRTAIERAMNRVDFATFLQREPHLRQNSGLHGWALNLSDDALAKIARSPEHHARWAQWLSDSRNSNKPDVGTLFMRAVRLGVYDWAPDAAAIHAGLTHVVVQKHYWSDQESFRAPLREFLTATAPRFATAAERVAAGARTPAAEARLAALGKQEQVAILHGPVAAGGSLEPLRLPLHELYDLHRREGLWHADAFRNGERDDYAFRELGVGDHAIDPGDPRLQLIPEEIAAETPEHAARRERLNALRAKLVAEPHAEDVTGYAVVQLNSTDIRDLHHNAERREWTALLRNGKRYQLVDLDGETRVPAVIGDAVRESPALRPADPTLPGRARPREDPAALFARRRR